MPSTKAFESAGSFEDARALVTFQPVQPSFSAGQALQSIRIHVRDHKQRELPAHARTLEAHYGRFVVSQSSKGAEEARRLALDVSYGRAPREALIAGRPGRMYELGPEPPPDDIDGRSPAVVTWHDGGMFYLIASGEMQLEELVPIALSLYREQHR